MDGSWTRRGKECDKPQTTRSSQQRSTSGGSPSPLRELLAAGPLEKDRLLLRHIVESARLMRENAQLRERQAWLEKRVFELEREMS